MARGGVSLCSGACRLALQMAGSCSALVVSGRGAS